ncbi:NAD-dependent protein deacylase [Alteromonas sp. ASW11-36]|uniref:NAD-dependent protein deacylase n=1 Tax=Alteromonas arenosi TaxID=3055817 RepID=A0ABT7SZ60_9ALTE|nr:Sir2 family NAD+-dependent deacetylase [Alteromonas sp. ASW11-36]MDM7860819.1 NAD-dependent protein deacylase [Alteromonas sp. ASW11-36]
MPNIVILTGAGISAESGLKTFRDNDGLWENHRLEDVATPEAFARDPALVYRFYNQRRVQLLNQDVRPNAAHIAIAKLQQRIGNKLTLVTQNVDNLHELAGTEDVVHMHGELLSARCLKSGKRFVTHDSFDSNARCECCEEPAGIRPDIVWFGEQPMYMDYIYNKLATADWFLAIGTSGNVYPAAGFVEVAKMAGAKTAELNLDPGANDYMFDYQQQGLATAVVPKFLSQFK